RPNHQDYIHEINTNLNLPTHKKLIIYPPTSTDHQFLTNGKYLFHLKIHLQNLYNHLPHHYLILLPIHYLIS
ncbi:CDP-glycerol glycerophosphotransferase family protein, partial [Staphylococcus capitis]|uniref:CDP-glycerol glycerophosphotransferase family protein n=1 Tax=Staphylococcus capitis TaxID=29388 RepID=UPI0016434C83